MYLFSVKDICMNTVLNLWNDRKNTKQGEISVHLIPGLAIFSVEARFRYVDFLVTGKGFRLTKYFELYEH